MKKLELAYLAGVIDSDGYISIKKSTYFSRKLSKNPCNATYCEVCGIKQVQPEAVQLIHKNFGGYYTICKPSSTNGKPLHSVTLANIKAYNFIKAIYPFLRLKKKQAEIVFKLRKSIHKKRGKVILRNQKNVWGQVIPFKKHVVSDSEIQYRESLIKEVKSLNDIRDWYYCPK